uniref:AF4/FMR2 family member 4 n=1 Tax=Phallusia mammillata TaxID=59560 RepID=A0A6F9D670_9ASCI|nr:AF4/FMR2 family member 4 [Phallusia mammillata]
MPNAKVDVEHAARLAANLSVQRDSGKHCDVCVCVSDKRFLAHKCVLSANSAKLDALILDAIGHNSNSQDIEIEIQGVSPVGFEKLLDFFYVGELKIEQQTVMPVWMTAAYLELPDVVSMCNEFCQQSVSNQPISDDAKTTRKYNQLQPVHNNSHNQSNTMVTDKSWSENDPEYIPGGVPKQNTKNATKKPVPNLNRVNHGIVPQEKINCEVMMAEVEQLRQQHQQLQRLQLEQTRLHGKVESKPMPGVQTALTVPTPVVPVEPITKRKKTEVDPEEDSNVTVVQVTSNTPLPSVTQALPDASDVSQSDMPPDFRIVTEQFRQNLYMRYPEIKPESPEAANCTANELLQRGKSRKRKSVEQNTLNNVIRLILDTIKIVDSTDPRVEDALFLIMDRFECLRGKINDPTVRRSLLVKVKHSIHCKKWRVKQTLNKSKGIDMDSSEIGCEEGLQE